MMLDTTTDQTDATPDVAHVATTATPAAEPKATRAKMRSEIVGDVLTITEGGVSETFDIGEAAAPSSHALKMGGLRHALSTAVDRAKTWAAIKDGTYGVRTAAMPKPLDPKRQAIANAIAEAQAKQQGLKPLPGKKLDAHPDYRMLLENASQQVAGWNKDQVKAAHAKADVAAHYARLSASGGSVLDLLGAPDLAA